MARDQVDLTPIERRDDLVHWLAQGAKPKAQFRIGTEHEKFVFTRGDHRPVPYEGRRGIRELLEGMQHLLGWQPIMEGPNIIGLFDVPGGGAISLEPGGQFELFGNSPFTEGKPNGYLSFRSEIWRDTDNARAGMLAWAFEPGMSFERWVDYALDVPMYFVKRGDDYIDASGQSFRDLLAGKLPALPGERATTSDWANHISTIFPEVRLKRYLEMRGADSGPLPNLLALPAFWVGLLYDDSCLDAAWDLVKDWSAEDRQHLRDEVPKHGLAAKVHNRTVFELATETLKLARSGLARRRHLDAGGRDETRYADVLEDRLARG